MNKSILKKKILMNITEDRAKTAEFVENISEYLNSHALGGEEYSKIMLSLSKLMEVSQKSNEQIVKIYETLSKKKSVKKDVDMKDDIDKIIQNREEVVEIGEE